MALCWLFSFIEADSGEPGGDIALSQNAIDYGFSLR